MNGFKLTSLQLKNFLTYSEEYLRLPKEGLIVIIGGNGTGKTSLFNALRFVLGSNQKDQRYRSWSDFINNRMNAAYGWVEAVFEGNGETIKLRREVRRGEAPRSYVNGRRVSADELRKVVREKLGIDPDNPLVFVPQGRVDAIRDMETEKLRAFIEELTGLAENRRIIDEKERELEVVRREAEKLREDILTFQEREARLALKFEKWKKRREVEERLKALESEAVWSRMAEWEAKLRELAEAERRAATSVEEKYAAFKKVAGEVEELERELGAKRAKEAEIDAEVNRLREERMNLEARLRGVLGGRDKTLENLRRKEEELERIKGDVEALRRRVKWLEEREKKLEDDRQKVLSKIEELRKELERISVEKEKFRGWEAEWRAAKAELERVKEKIEVLSKEKARVGSELERVGRRILECNRRVAELVSIVENYDEDGLKRRREELRSERERLVRASIRVEDEVKKYDEKINALRKMLLNVGSRVPEQVEMLERDVKNRRMEVEGPLLKLIEVDDKYAKATEAIFGRELLAFVAFDEPDFQVLNELRKKYNAWCTIYLPKTLEAPALGRIEDEGVIGWLEDVLKFPERVRVIIREITRRTLLVKDFKSALALSRKYKGLRFVTVDGEVVEDFENVLRSPHRKIKGLLDVKRITEELEESVIARGRLEEELKSLKEKLDELRREEERVERALTVIPEWRMLLREKMTLEEEEKKLKDELRMIEENLASISADRERAERTLRKVEERKPKDYTELEKAEMEALRELEGTRRELDRLEAELRKVMKEREGALLNMKMLEATGESVSKEIDLLREEVVRGSEEAEELTRKIDELKIVVEEWLARKRDYERSIEVLLQKLGERRERMKVLEETLGEGRKELESIKKEISAAKERLKELEREVRERGFVKPARVRSLPEIEVERTLLEEELASLADVDEGVVKEKEELERERGYLTERFEKVREELQGILEELERRKEEHMVKLVEAVDEVEREVNELLGSVNMRCKLRVAGGYSEAGVEVKLSVKGGPLVNVTAASGGERCFFAIALMAALQKKARTPLVVLDEPSMHLDSENTERTGKILKEISSGRQLLVLVPDKYLEFTKYADQCYGTATSSGVSVVIPARIKC
ncbi:MAG: chromosome segregation SMC family protein [Candidatus Jordarchaeales archaeon]